MQPPDAASQHPVDQLIVRLIREEIEASPDDVQRIVERMATAPFSRRLVRVPRLDRGLVYGRIVLGRSADSLDYHLAKRVRGERQWADGTTGDSTCVTFGRPSSIVRHASWSTSDSATSALRP